VIGKVAGGHFGDRSFDGYDWVPLIAVLLSAGLIFAGLFPNGFNNFGLNNGNIVLNNGREGRRVDDLNEDYELSSSLDLALQQLEAGLLLVGGLRAEEDGCAERLACKLGGLARKGFTDTDLVLGTKKGVVG